MNDTPPKQKHSRKISEHELDIDIDKITKRKGPKETMQLEMVSDKIEGMSDGALSYFTGFLNPLASKERHKQADKQVKAKPMIKFKNIIKIDKNEDLLATWDKKYNQVNKTVVTKDDWGNEDSMPAMAKVISNKTMSHVVVNEYVENVLANQHIPNGEEFEENWDEEDGSPMHDKNKFRKVNKENKHSRPDLISGNAGTKKKKHKKKITRKGIVQNNSLAYPKPVNDEDFDENWDE
jgi:hypothetical protein